MKIGMYAAVMLVVAATAAAGQSVPDVPVTCSGAITGTVSSLVVPSGVTCSATHLVVTGNVTILSGGTLESDEPGQCDPTTANPFTVGGRISVGADGALQVASTSLLIGSITAQNARALGVTRIPCTGSTGTIGGDIAVVGTTAVGLLDLSVDGSIFVRNSGAEGLEFTANIVGGTVSIENCTVVGATRPSLFALSWNTVRKGMVVAANDATKAYVPLFIGANTILGGNLICENNVPSPTDVDVDVVLANAVLSGQKLGQCRGL